MPMRIRLLGDSPSNVDRPVGWIVRTRETQPDQAWERWVTAVYHLIQSRGLCEIIQVLNECFGTNFTEEDRLFFEQIKVYATAHSQVTQTAMANPLA